MPLSLLRKNQSSTSLFLRETTHRINKSMPKALRVG